ncbi:LOW QUALITY PROTEIN: protein O-glucosyltransferase 3-like [Erethizon dorsatum]
MLMGGALARGPNDKPASQYDWNVKAFYANPSCSLKQSHCQMGRIQLGNQVERRNNLQRPKEESRECIETGAWRTRETQQIKGIGLLSASAPQPSLATVSFRPALLLQLGLAHLLAADRRGTGERGAAWCGAGLHVTVSLPGSYFYLQVVSALDQNLPCLLGPQVKHYKVVVKPLSRKEVVWVQVPKPLDRNDGTFLVQYRMYDTVNKGLKIEVLYGDEHVAQCPYILEGPLYHEYCKCPAEDPQAWQKILFHPTNEPQTEEDFSFFPNINLQQMLKNEVPKRSGEESGAIVHYTILNNHIYLRSLGKYTAFKMFSDETLLSLTRKYKYLTNVDGTVAAYSLYRMLGDSLVLKQDSPHYEHFYVTLRPWKHYVSIKRNLSDLLEKVKWAKENDEEAKKITKKGQLTAGGLLQPHRLYYYYYRALWQHAECQPSKPEIRDGTELVPQPCDNIAICQCHGKGPLKEEL